jgi:hypothetical protein
MSREMRWGDLVVTGDERRRRLSEHDGNGVDGAEVHHGGRRLLVYFFGDVPRGLRPGNIRIDAPRGARPVRAVGVHRAEDLDPETEDHLAVELDHPGSAGSYLLRLVEQRPDGTPGWRPYRGVDPRFAQVRFVFTAAGDRGGARRDAGRRRVGFLHLPGLRRLAAAHARPARGDDARLDRAA